MQQRPTSNRPFLRQTAIIGGVLFLGALAIAVDLLLYYPVRPAVMIGCVMVGLSLLSLWRPHWGLFVLFALGPLFGNHPGGHFMEVFPVLLLHWTGAALLRMKEPPAINGAFLLAGELFCITLFLPVVFQAWPILDSMHRRHDAFHILIADEHNPLYTMQQLVWTTALFLFAGIVASESTSPASVRPQTLARTAAAGIAAGFATTVIAGVADAWLPAAAQALDAYHKRIDGSVDRAPSHFLVLGAAFSPNSLFWNRSWHGIYLISGLPFVFLFFVEKASSFTTSRAVTAATALITYLAITSLGSFYLIVLGARGAIVAFLAFALMLLPAVVALAFPVVLEGRSKGAPGGLASTMALKVLAALVPLTALAALLLHVGTPIVTVVGNLASGEPRFAQYAEALRIFSFFPLTGGGIESYGYYNTNALQGVSLAAPHGTAHSQWLQVLSGMGIPGAAAYLLMLFLAWGAPWRHRDPETVLHSFRSSILLAGLAAVFVYSTVQEWWYLKPVQAAWWLLLALCIHERKESGAPHRWAGWLRGLRWSFYHQPKPLWLLALPLLIAVVVVIIGPVLRRTPPISSRVEISSDEVLSVADLPEVRPSIRRGPMLWHGVEYIGQGRFVVMEGSAWIVLPEGMKDFRVEPVTKDGQSFRPSSLRVGWASVSNGDRFPGGRILFLACLAHPAVADRGRDYDGRRLCAELALRNAQGLLEHPSERLFERPIEGQYHRLF